MSSHEQTRCPTRPGILLDRILSRRGITQQELADALCVSRYSVNQIINGHRTITPDMAVRLSRVLGSSPELWMGMQNRLNLFLARKNIDELNLPLKMLREVDHHEYEAKRPDQDARGVPQAD